MRGGDGIAAGPGWSLSDDGKRNEVEMDVVFVHCFSERRLGGGFGGGRAPGRAWPEAGG